MNVHGFVRVFNVCVCMNVTLGMHVCKHEAYLCTGVSVCMCMGTSAKTCLYRLLHMCAHG